MNNNFQTRDFYLASFLMAMGVPLNSLTRQDNISLFSFNDVSNAQKHADDYFGMKALINPVAYGQSFKHLKSILHSKANSDASIQQQFTRTK